MDCSQYPLVAAYLFVAIMLKNNFQVQGQTGNTKEGCKSL